MPALILARPQPSEYSPFYAGYVSSVPDGDLIAILERDETRALLGGLSDEVARQRYAPGKWSVKEVVGHIADTERVMSYRALRFGRGDPTPLAGFEQEDFVRGASWDEIPLATLLDDLAAVRRATLSLFRGFSEAALARQGTANATPVTVRALAAIIAGHERHHLRIVRERYLA
jgi:hypothetical protein